MPNSPRRTTTPPAVDDRFPVSLRGVDVDEHTRCAHYDTDRDVIAIRFACCDTFYPCHRCHVVVADHDPMPIPATDLDEPSVLCGRCGTTHTAEAYLASPEACPACSTPFNPNCRDHHDRYFDA